MMMKRCIIKVYNRKKQDGKTKKKKKNIRIKEECKWWKEGRDKEIEEAYG